MSKSQFLHLYLKQLIANQWVNWSEDILNEAPAQTFHTPRGFQEIAGASNATLRTRAGEAYRLGLITGRLVNERGAGSAQIPAGWQSLLSNQAVHTRLGCFAYVIGKALKIKPDSQALLDALDAIASLQIPLICFQHQGRWYSTVNLFTYAKKHFESSLQRSLNEEELRYFAGAVFDTLDGSHQDTFIQSYGNDSPLSQLFFETPDGPVELTSTNLSDIVQHRVVDVIYPERPNSIGDVKGTLYWVGTSRQRGIYTQAIQNAGAQFLQELCALDQKYASNNTSAILHRVLDSIYSIGRVEDVMIELSKEAERSAELMATLGLIMSIMGDGVAEALNIILPEHDHPFLDKAVQSIRTVLEEKHGASYETTQSTLDAGMSLDDNQFDWEPVIHENQLHNIFQSPPETLNNSIQGNVKSAGSRVGKFDPAERDAKNRALGLRGEEFVYHIERARLEHAGRMDLATQVVHISKEIGDGAGYDIRSFDDLGQEIFIEVKTTKNGANTPIYLSINELLVSLGKGEQYRLYRVYNFGSSPSIFILQGALDTVLNLQPVAFRAVVKPREE